MVVYVNGALVPEAEARLSVFDRAFLYGDSLFETLRVCNGRVFRWNQHLDRLQRSAAALGFQLPTPPAELRRAARLLIEQNHCTDALLRLTLTRGVGPRGYSPRGAHSPAVVMSLHEAPALEPEPVPAWRVVTSQMRLAPGDRLALHKTGSKLFQVLARQEAEAAGADEALLVNTNGEVAEGASANLFWVRGGVIYTSPTAVGMLPGVTRAVVLEICAQQGLTVKKRLLQLGQLLNSDALIFTNSAHGVVEGRVLDGHTFPGSELVGQLRRLYVELVRKECGVTAAAPQNPQPASIA